MTQVFRKILMILSTDPNFSKHWPQAMIMILKSLNKLVKCIGKEQLYSSTVVRSKVTLHLWRSLKSNQHLSKLKKRRLKFRVHLKWSSLLKLSKMAGLIIIISLMSKTYMNSNKFNFNYNRMMMMMMKLRIIIKMIKKKKKIWRRSSLNTNKQQTKN